MDSLSLQEMTPLGDAQGLRFSITARACQKIKNLAEKDQTSTAGSALLKIKVEGGGCAGFQYTMDLVFAPAGKDIVFQTQETQVCIDLASLHLISGSVLDYEEDMMSAAFVVKNPNAVTACGCGNSFSVL